MPAKRSSDVSPGCLIIGIALLVLTLGWPLLAFHRHWTTSYTVSCANDNWTYGCTYDPNTGNYVGTGTEVAGHTAISATGWIVEAIWLALTVGSVFLLGAISSRRKGTKRSPSQVPMHPRSGYDVVDPSLSGSSIHASALNPDKIVRFTALDAYCQHLLKRAQEAINDVLTCKVYAQNQLQQAVTEPTLRRHEWAIAVNLREITNLRAEQARMAKLRVEGPGPLTKAVLDAQQAALKQKLKKVESLVKALENYSSHVKAADMARLDWEAAAELAKLNPRFSDLVAGTAADEIHLQEVHDLTDEASTFRTSLLQANLAAEPLLLPDV